MLRKSEFENSRYQTLNLNAYWLNFTKFFFEPLISARSFLYDLHALNSLQFMMDGSDTCRNHFIRVFQLKIAMWIPSEIFPTRTVSSDSLFREKGAFSARFKRPLVSSLHEIFRWKGVPLRKLEKTTRRYLFSPFFCTGNIQPS